MVTGRRMRLLQAACALALLSPVPAGAETLADAVALAYASNPTLQAQRAQLRALDENYVQARQGFRPTADASADVSYANNQAAFEQDSNSAGATLSATQPLYTGGRTANAVRAAEAAILAGREDLRQIEASVLLSVIQAYADVRRDFQSLGIRQENVSVLRRQLEESQARFDVGEITRTDVAQSEARLASAQALLASAQSQLAISRSGYAAVVGQNPGDLEPEPPLPGVPDDIDVAFDVAQVENAALRSAAFAEESSRSRIAQARSDLRPSVSLRATLGYDGPIVPFDRRDVDRSFATSAVVSQPLYAGGLRRSRIRQTTEQNTADVIEIEGTRRDVLRNVSQSFYQVLAARGNIAANLEQVRANRIAAEGVREEAAVGLRTTIEVLNAEQELRNSELLLVNARRDDYVAGASLLSGMGRLEARNLLPGVDVYDPAANFQRVRRKGGVPWEPLVERLDNVLSPVPAETPVTPQPFVGAETVATAR